MAHSVKTSLSRMGTLVMMILCFVLTALSAYFLTGGGWLGEMFHVIIGAVAGMALLGFVYRHEKVFMDDLWKLCFDLEK
jgi:hypothetical protein